MQHPVITCLFLTKVANNAHNFSTHETLAACQGEGGDMNGEQVADIVLDGVARVLLAANR